MAGGGITGRNNFRKMYTANAKKSKYAAVLETPEMLREKELKEKVWKLRLLCLLEIELQLLN